MPPVPEWLTALIGALLGGAVAWGTLRATVRSMLKRLDDLHGDHLKLATRIEDLAAAKVRADVERENTGRHVLLMDRMEARVRRMELRVARALGDVSDDAEDDEED